MGVPVEPEVKTYATICPGSICGTGGAEAPAGALPAGQRTCGRSTGQSSSSVRHTTSGAKALRRSITSGVCVEGRRLTLPAVSAAANPTANW